MSLASCSIIGPSDKLIQVYGSVQGRLYDDGCELHLLEKGDKVARSYNIRKISSIPYKEDYTISPKGRGYLVNLVCGGRLITSKEAKFPFFKDHIEINMGLTVEIQT